MRGLIYTGPSTILHNLRKTVERAGIEVENIIIFLHWLLPSQF